MSEQVIQGMALEIGGGLAVRPAEHAQQAAEISAKGPTLIVIAPGRVRGFGFKWVLKDACEQLREEETGKKVRGSGKAKEIVRLKGLKAIEGEYVRYSAQVKRQQSVEPKVMFVRPAATAASAPADQAQLEKQIDEAIEFLDKFLPDSSAQSPPSDSGSDSQLQLARERREQLLAQEKWFNAPQVHVQQGKDPKAGGANNTASKLRRENELLGVWNGREYLHPQFQFDTLTGLLMTEVKQLLELLPKDRSGWRQAFWLFQKHAQLEGKRPADVFQKDAARVIEAARSDFVTSDERW